jgi:hypothetical protein
VRHERATEETRQQAALYTLGLLTQHEAHCFELHLEECFVCREEHVKQMSATAQIGLAIKEEKPPNDLSERLAERIDFYTHTNYFPDLPQNHSSTPVYESENSTDSEKVTESWRKNFYVPVYNPDQEELFSADRITFITHVAAYSILSILVILGIYIWFTSNQEKAQLHNRLEASEDGRAELKWQLDQLGPVLENAEKLGKFQEMLHKPSVRIARLKGQPSTPDDTGTVLWDSIDNNILVVGTFEPAPEGKVYHLWFSVSSERISVGPLQSDIFGSIFTSINLDRHISATSIITAIITLESDSDLSIRKEPAWPWSATGRLD